MPELPANIIRKMNLFHCARGQKNCLKCKKLFEEGEKFCLLSLVDKPETAQEVISIEVDGKKTWTGFSVELIFKNEAEARAYSKKNEVKIISG